MTDQELENALNEQESKPERRKIALSIRWTAIKWTTITILLILGMMPWINPDTALRGIGEQVANWTGVTVAPVCETQTNNWSMTNEL